MSSDHLCMCSMSKEKEGVFGLVSILQCILEVPLTSVTIHTPVNLKIMRLDKPIELNLALN